MRKKLKDYLLERNAQLIRVMQSTTVTRHDFTQSEWQHLDKPIPQACDDRSKWEPHELLMGHKLSHVRKIHVPFIPLVCPCYKNIVIVLLGIVSKETYTGAQNTMYSIVLHPLFF